MTTSRFDVVIIGGGNGGMGVSVATAKAGMSVAMIEPAQLGGTCSNRGCTPKRVLMAAGHALEAIGQAHFHKIDVGPPKLDWAALIDREQEIIRGIPDRLDHAMRLRGVRLISGRGKFAGPNAVVVGDDVYEAGHIVVATGSRPRPLAIPGAEMMITSDDILVDRAQPRDSVFVGGGVVAFEFSHLYVRAGTRVTILEPGERFLARLDVDAVHQLVAESRRLGIDARTGARVRRVEPTGRRLRVVFEEAGTEQVVEVDRVVNSAGRVPDIDGLDLARGNVAVEHGRIAVDQFLRSVSNPAVYACGDALPGKPQLSPIATYDGRIVGENIVGTAPRAPDYASIPACIYTIPTLATVGLSEREARERGLKFGARVSDMREWLSGRTFAEPVAWSKVLVEEGSRRVLGAHMVGHGGEELIHLFALAMRHGISASQLTDVDAVYAFPTLAADVRHIV
jgi:glutathione reductase (NADPH)